MVDFVIKNCKGCRQPLRIPGDIGGMLMQCPNCGHEFYTDFKLSFKGREAKVGKGRGQKKSTQRPSSGFKVIV